MKRKILTLLIFISVISVFKISDAFYPSVGRMLSIFSEVFDIVKKEYVQEVGDKSLIEAAISGMLTSLDPHSGYLNEREYEELKASARGEFGGLGIEIIIDNGLRIITPIDDTPAFHAGIKPGDLIIAVDDESVIKMSPNEAVNKMKGARGTKVKLTVIREGEAEPIEFNMIRDIIKIKTVKWHLYENIGYIRITSFTGQTANNVKKAILSLIQESNDDLKGYILDLRNNPGGMLEQSIYVSELFLEDGIIVSTKGRNKKDNQVYRAHAGTLVGGTPIVVLINGGSASASEIVAGALQDHKRAVVMGTKSFGKASVQSIIPINNLGALRMTTALYYTPSGKSIQKEGIQPDIIVEQTKEKSEADKDKMQGHNSDEKEGSDEEGKKDKNRVLKTVEALKNENWVKLFKNDYQLSKAIELLKNVETFGTKQ